MAKKKKKKNNKRVDLDVRPKGPWFSNYDYGGPDKPSKTSPGRGLYNGPMDKYKSVTDFLNKKKKSSLTADELVRLASAFESLVAAAEAEESTNKTE